MIMIPGNCIAIQDVILPNCKSIYNVFFYWANLTSMYSKILDILVRDGLNEAASLLSGYSISVPVEIAYRTLSRGSYKTLPRRM
jgi:hypothetical protein